METIRVPKPAPEAFQKHRRATDLVLSQVAHFQHVAEKKSLKIDPQVAREVHTEGGAARFIGAVTRAIHAAASTAKGKVIPMKRVQAAESESAPGTVRSIAAEAETPKTKARSGTASKPKMVVKKSVETAAKQTAKKAAKKTAKKAVKQTAKKSVKRAGAGAVRTSTAARKSSTGGKPKAAKAGAKAKSKPRKRS